MAEMYFGILVALAVAGAIAGTYVAIAHAMFALDKVGAAIKMTSPKAEVTLSVVITAVYFATLVMYLVKFC